ncbi:hypothetical protein ACQ4WX_44765 [Streptomyces lasalocidi]
MLMTPGVQGAPLSHGPVEAAAPPVAEPPAETATPVREPRILPGAGDARPSLPRRLEGE